MTARVVADHAMAALDGAVSVLAVLVADADLATATAHAGVAGLREVTLLLPGADGVPRLLVC